MTALRTGLVVVAAIVGGCGGGDDTNADALKPPPLTVPGYSGTPKVSKPKEAPGADTAAAKSAQADEAASDTTTTETQTGATHPESHSDATAESAASPPSNSTGGASAQFQEFCANNAGAC